MKDTRPAIILPNADDEDLWAIRRALGDKLWNLLGAVVVELTEESRWCAMHHTQMVIKDACHKRIHGDNLGSGRTLGDRLEGRPWEPCVVVKAYIAEGVK